MAIILFGDLFATDISVEIFDEIGEYPKECIKDDLPDYSDPPVITKSQKPIPVGHGFRRINRRHGRKFWTGKNFRKVDVKH